MIRTVSLPDGTVLPADLDAARNRFAIGFYEGCCSVNTTTLEAMHRTIAVIAGHPDAWQTILGAKGALDRVRRLSLVDLAWARKRLTEHRRIVAAIVSRRPAEAVATMRQHLESVFAAVDQIRAGHEHYFIDTGHSA